MNNRGSTLQLGRAWTISGVVVCSLLLTQFAAGADPQVWLTNPSAGLSQGAQARRPVLFHFGAHWCPPCQKMEAQVFPNPGIRNLLQQAFVAVKVDSDKFPGDGQRYGVESLPCDVVLDPFTGQILARSNGFLPANQYGAFLQGAAAKFRPPAPEIAKTPAPRTQQVQRVTREREEFPTGPIELDIQLGDPQSLTGLEGFSPVSLAKNRSWVRGFVRYQWIYKDVPYFMASEEEWRTFRDEPERYAPKLLGCDPVILWESDRAVAGDIRHGAYFDGELYLFTSAQTRDRFKADPARYTRLRHAIKRQEIERTVIR